MTTLRFGHSPDADDAYMFYGISNGLVDLRGNRVEHVISDIQSLNRRAMESADLEITAISAAAIPQVAGKYRVMTVGCSMARGYGPKVIRRPGGLGRGRGKVSIAVPGDMTTACLLWKLYAAEDGIDYELTFVYFEDITSLVASGGVDFGIIIHEDQLRYRDMGLDLVVDLGKWWLDLTQLPIPLGVDCVRSDLALSVASDACGILRDSVLVALANREAAIDYAIGYGRGVDRDTCREFVGMYVNSDTLEMGEEGRDALQRLFAMAVDMRIIDVHPAIEYVGC